MVVILYGHFVLIYCTVVLGLRCELLLLCLRVGHGTANLVYNVYIYLRYTHARVCRNLGATGAKRRQQAIARSNILLFRQLPVNRIINVKYI